MVRSAGIADRQRRHPDAAERFHPVAEDRPDRLVLLQVDTADCAGAVVDIEVAGKLRVFGFQRIAGLATAASAAGLWLCRRGSRRRCRRRSWRRWRPRGGRRGPAPAPPPPPPTAAA